MNNIKILGHGKCVPDKVLTNTDLEKMVDTSDEWIKARTGMSNRFIADKDTASSDLGISASMVALKSAGLDPLDVDLIITATATPDMVFPSTACFIQKGINAKNAAAFDLSAVCSGFVYGLSVAEQYIKTGKYKNILLIGTEVVSKFIDWEDRSTCILFGDGAGAVVLSVDESNEKKIFSTILRSNGEFADILCIPGGGSRNPASPEMMEKRLQFVKMDGSKIFKTAVTKMSKVAKEILAENKFDINDVDLVIPHQANFRIIKSLADHLKLPMEKVFVNIEKYGNTSAASIPIALSEALDEGRIKSGSIILLLAFGGGLTWGAALIEW